MTQQIINTGTGPNAQDGDSLYVAFTKINDNFNSIWAQGPVDSNISIANNSVISTDVNGNIVLTPNGIGYVRLDNNTIPGANNTYFLGDTTRRWRGIYAGSAGINTTGNLYAGNLIIEGNTEFDGNISFTGSVDVAGDFNTNGNITGNGSLTIPGNITAGPGMFYGDVGITGNLQVAGNIVYIDVEELRIEDPIIELGGGPNGTPLTNPDGYSRGLQLDYFNVAANTQQIGFTGLAAPDYTTYQFLINATNTANTYTGTPANLYFGNADVTGQVNVAGNVNSGAAVNANLVNATTFTGNEASITGNIYSGNIINEGIITSVGNIVSTSNVAGAYILGNGYFLTGVITSVSNISNGTSRVDIPTMGSDILVDVNGTTNVAVFTSSGLNVNGVVSAAGNVVANNFSGNTISIATNITGGNISTTGRIIAGTHLSAIGNVSGTYFIGNGALLTGIDTTLISNGASNVKVESANGNVTINVAGNNIATYDATGEFVTGVISATGTISGSYLYSSGELSAAGNIVGNNLNVTNVVSAAGNVYGGNVVTGTLTTTAGNLNVTAPGNVLLQPTGNVVLFDRYINGVADPVQAQDAATKSYVDNAVSASLNIHTPVYVERPDTDGNLPGVYTDGGTVITVTDIINGSTLTTFTAHGLSINDMIIFGTTSNGLVANTAYFVYQIPGANQLILADAYDGQEITDLEDGTGLSLSSRANPGVGATLSNAGPLEQLVLDGVTLTGGERVLIYTQDNAIENGVYVVTDAGSTLTPWILTRATDSNKYIPNSPQGTSIGDYFFVQAGDTGAGESYVLNQPVNPIIFGISGIDFVQFSSSQVYNAGAGLELDATTFNVLVDPETLEINGSNEVAIKAGANLVTPNIGNATGSSLSLTGNITAGNANIGSIELSSVSVSGNVIGGNIYTGGIVSATGDITGANVSGSNLLTSGLISATGNITGANVMAVTFYGNVKGGNVSLTANVLAGNVNTSGQISATGNGTFGNINTAGNVAANGILTDNYYYANGQPLDMQQPAGSNTWIQINDNGDFGASANLTFNTGTRVFYVGGAASITGNSDVGNLNTSGNAAVGGIKTDNYMYANGQPLDMQQPAGSNTQIQFNNNNDFGASANLTFDSDTNLLTVDGNASVTGTISSGNITVNNWLYTPSGTNLVVSPGNTQVRIIANTEPYHNDSWDLGAENARWRTLYANVGNFSGDISAVGTIQAGNLLTNGLISATGNITSAANISAVTFSGNLEGNYASLSANVDAGNLLTTGGISATGNLTAGNIDTAGHLSAGPADFAGDVNIVGNLNVDGNVTYIDVKDLRIEDPIIELGGGPNGTPLTTNDGFSRGLKLDYFDTTANTNQFGFMGLAASDYNTYQFLTDATDVGNTFTGTPANLYFGNASVTGNIETNGILTDNYYYANGAPVDFEQPAGSNTWIQFNNNSDFGASANLTFDSDTNLLTVTGNIAANNLSIVSEISTNTVTALGNVDAGNILTSGIVSATGNIYGATLVGNIASDSISVSGNVDAGNVNSSGNIAANGVLTDNYYYANGAPVDFQQAAGSNTWIQFNNNNDFGASANLTFDSANNQLYVNGMGSFVGNVIAGNVTTSGLISATGNIDGGNLSGEYIIGTLTTNAQPNITSLGTLTGLNVSGSISAAGNITGNNLNVNDVTANNISGNDITGNDITGNIITGNVLSSVGNAYIGGNLYVSGNVTYINITDLNVQDPIISMGRGPNNTPLTVNDGKDRGEQLWYYTDQEYSAFIGWDNSTNNLIAALDVTNNNEVISVNNWGNFVVGNLYTQDVNSSNVFYVDGGNGVVLIGNSTVTDGATLAINATDSALMPIGNSFQRPETPTVGMVRFNSTLDTLEFYTDVNGWISAGATEIGSITSQTFTADGGTTVFNLTNPSTSVDAMVQINGVTQVPLAAYTIVNSVLTFSEPPEAGDTIEVRELAAQSTVHAITNSSGNASMSVNDASSSVTLEGILQLNPTTQPSSPQAGMVYFDIGTNKLRCYDGTIWHDLF
jgi:hypothetical protein